MINRSKTRDRRFWKRWCDSGAVANVDGLCVDFWMIKRFRPTVHAARATIFLNGKPLGHVVGFTPVGIPRTFADLPPVEDLPPVFESVTFTLRRLP